MILWTIYGVTQIIARLSLWVSYISHLPVSVCYISFAGDLFKKKLQVAVAESQKHHDQHEAFCDAVPEATREEWIKMICEWEEDKDQPDPYVVEMICVFLLVFRYLFHLTLHSIMFIVQSQAAITLELVEAERASFGASQSEAGHSSPSAFIISGLEIEEAQ
jgi:hypothetical protein